MKFILLILLLSLMAGFALAGENYNLSPGEIYECGDLSESGVYLLMKDIQASETCFTASADGITLDLNRHSILGNGKGFGVFAYGSDYIVLKNGLIERFYSGISLRSSNSIFGNLTLGNNLVGIEISGDNNSFLGNTIENNFFEGILLSGDGNSIRGNLLKGNDYGIAMKNSEANEISDNFIFGSGLGIYLMNFTSSNLIHNNYFNNKINVGYYGSNLNLWNVSYRSGPNIIGGPYIGGNYWGNQNDPRAKICEDKNNDGLCDSPLTLLEDNMDYLPLTF